MRNQHLDSFSTLKSTARYWARVHGRTGDWGSLHIVKTSRKFISQHRRSVPPKDWNRETEPINVYNRPARRLPA